MSLPPTPPQETSTPFEEFSSLSESLPKPPEGPPPVSASIPLAASRSIVPTLPVSPSAAPEVHHHHHGGVWRHPPLWDEAVHAMHVSWRALRRRRRRHRLRRFILLVGLELLVIGAIWSGGLVWFAQTIPRETVPKTHWAELQHTDAIVVLTGGSARLGVGVELLSAGLARKLFVSGVYHSVEVRELLKLSRIAPGELECCIVLGYAADNTVGNAVETADWMAGEKFHSLRLVTANYHMRRSLLEFSLALPNIQIIPHPVIPVTVRLNGWWSWPGTTALIITEYNKYLLALVRFGLTRMIDALRTAFD
ncbi:hypothetical protein CCP2SC5_320009 [Azospirillaceae bacterium]